MSKHPMKKLYKSKDSRIAGGVIGGLSEWMEVNPNILRTGYVALAVVTAIVPAALIYAAAHFIIPKKKD